MISISKLTKELKEKYRETKKSSIIAYIILRVLVILCMIRQILIGDINNAFLCALTLILFTIPTFVQKKFKLELPSMLETIIYVFIFSAEILGEIYNFYGNISNWDTILHTINGFLCAGIGLSLVDLLNENSNKINLAPFYVVLVGFCFSMTVGVCWEFVEYSADKLLLLDMQKDQIVTTISTVSLNPNSENKPVVIKNIDKTILYDKDGNVIGEINNGYLDIGINDTMKDLFVNLIGAVTFSFIGYFYLKNKNKYKFAKNFIPKKE